MMEKILKSVRDGVSQIVLDSRSKALLLKQAEKANKRGQKRILKDIQALVENAHRDNKKGLDPILRRCYYSGGSYKGSEHLQYFMKRPVDTWLNESVMKTLMGEKDTLQRKVKSPKQIQNMKYPVVDRELPSLAKLMELPSTIEKEIEPLPITIPEEEIKRREFLDEMVRQVLQLQNFLSGAGLMHTRKFSTPIAVVPITPLGTEIAACRKNNLIKKKVTYLRGIFYQLPPLNKDDSAYLTSIVENSNTPSPERSQLSYELRREYKKFVRKSYIIEEPFKLTMNKYAYSQPKEIDESFAEALEL